MNGALLIAVPEREAAYDGHANGMGSGMVVIKFAEGARFGGVGAAVDRVVTTVAGQSQVFVKRSRHWSVKKAGAPVVARVKRVIPGRGIPILRRGGGSQGGCAVEI